MPGETSHNLTSFLKAEYFHLRNYVRTILDDAADRDSADIVNDVVVRLFEKADICAPIEDMAAYIYQALRNNVVDTLRRKRVPVESLDNEDIQGGHVIEDTRTSLATQYEQRELGRRIDQAIAALPPELGQVFVLHEIERRTYADIAARTGIPPGTFMARKARALELLRHELRDCAHYLED